MKRLIHILVASLLLGNDISFAQEAVETDFQTIKKGSLSGPYDQKDEQSVLVINNQKDFKEFWNKTSYLPEFAEQMPDINFNQHYLIVAVDRVRPRGGYDIEIESVKFYDRQQNPSGYTIRLSIPSSGVTLSAEINRPYHLIRIER